MFGVLLLCFAVSLEGAVIAFICRHFKDLLLSVTTETVAVKVLIAVIIAVGVDGFTVIVFVVMYLRCTM